VTDNLFEPMLACCDDPNPVGVSARWWRCVSCRAEYTEPMGKAMAHFSSQECNAIPVVMTGGISTSACIICHVALCQVVDDGETAVGDCESPCTGSDGYCNLHRIAAAHVEMADREIRAVEANQAVERVAEWVRQYSLQRSIDPELIHSVWSDPKVEMVELRVSDLNTLIGLAKQGAQVE
jgi:hypothetical protein